MAMVQSISAPAAEENGMDFAHGIQQSRQAYLTRLVEHSSVKMEEMRQEADANEESSQTFQAWLADQIFESANFLSLQFTESVVTRTWRKI